MQRRDDVHDARQRHAGRRRARRGTARCRARSRPRARGSSSARLRGLRGSVRTSRTTLSQSGAAADRRRAGSLPEGPSKMQGARVRRTSVPTSEVWWRSVSVGSGQQGARAALAPACSAAPPFHQAWCRTPTSTWPRTGTRSSDLLTVFSAAGCVSYVVIGGLVARDYGKGRSTTGVDLIVLEALDEPGGFPRWPAARVRRGALRGHAPEPRSGRRRCRRSARPRSAPRDRGGGGGDDAKDDPRLAPERGDARRVRRAEVLRRHLEDAPDLGQVSGPGRHRLVARARPQRRGGAPRLDDRFPDLPGRGRGELREASSTTCATSGPCQDLASYRPALTSSFVMFFW